MRKSVLVVAALALAGCAGRPESAPTPQVSADLAAMNGYWVGEFETYQAGSRGSITLTVRSSTDTAFGDIVIVPSGFRPVVAADVKTHLNHSAAPEMLRVSFKRVFGGMVEGVVEDYFSERCGCVVTTLLQGTPTKNQIAGEFVTSDNRGVRERGTWSVERVIVAADDDR